MVNFSKGECLFCDDCVDACKTGALNKTGELPNWSVFAELDETNCLAYKNIECRSCYDPCENGSINMTPRLGGVSIPTINSETCTGCGACFSVCPNHSISMNNNPQTEQR